MGIRVAVHHVTTYRYDRRIRLGPQVVRLRPAAHTRTNVESYSLRVKPKDNFINWQQDPHGNYLARLVFPEPTRSLELAVDLVANLAAVNPFDFFLEPSAEMFPFKYEPGLARQLAPYLELEPQGKLFNLYLEGIDRRPQRSNDFLVEFNQRIQRDLDYTIRLEPGLQTPEETLERRLGACRDFAWLATMLLRHLGIAARFVSGYSIQLRPDVKPLEGAVGVAEDIVDLHAWTEAYLPGAGWVGMDSTSGLLTGEGHIPLACTPSPGSAAPITGGLDECETEFGHLMTVTRLREDPRNTRPYSEGQWERILVRGEEVQKRLDARDVRLTMGGEPTFVSIDDFVGAEWTTAALGDVKRRRSEELIKRLRRRFAPGGALHYGQGKWYPGESLPRWALGCYWRTDGQPIWNDEQWIADPAAPAARPADVAAAESFCRALAKRLGVESELTVPAFEDVAYYLWKEGRFPVDVDPTDAKLGRKEDRARLARVFDRGLGTPAGWVLPLEATTSDAGAVTFRSGAWRFRTGHLFLVPGDSPIGLRLPLDSRPWGEGEEAAPPIPVDPTVPRGPLPAREHLQLPAAPARKATERSRRADPSPKGLVRSALCVEARDGRVCVFLPPVVATEPYLALLAAIEDTAAALDQPVVVEGYTPPDDPRLRCIKVTPDPGVIEVNVHPAESWNELTAITLGLYEDARQCRLSPEKYLIDGRVVGTGGGNHIVLGAKTPLDSPFLRRPDLLKSVLGYWNNHPSLSYLFSSLFIGPTSQAPRMDEGRPESVLELELAFDRLSRGNCPPWLVDRIFRDLLADGTGNTHRTELCIDKLYSPDTASGRQGLVEVRSFEMPPHPRMSLAQQLLLRALVAWFWDEPYRVRPARFGTVLQDRYMLPHFVTEDFHGVLADLERAGMPLDPSWFAPHVEFRFPRIGTVAYGGVELELRTALEPWHVLGEDPGGGGTVRYVDSSLERLQVKVRGAIDGRHAIACNGYRVPLHPTGTAGEYIAGVRFRAWQPPRCLHPTIAPHAPLVFDVYDAWSGRSFGGCTYHVSHPGGRHHEDPPVNPLEAEGRRQARFSAMGHTPGPFTLTEPPPSREMPLTLDLRRAAP